MCRIRTKGWKFTPDKFVEYKGFESKPPNPTQNKKPPLYSIRRLWEREGFEPPEGCPSTVFKRGRGGI